MVPSADSTPKQVGRAFIILAGSVIAGIIGWYLFVIRADGSLGTLIGILLVIGLILFMIRIGRQIATSLFGGYNVAEVEIRGPIRRDGGQLPPQPRGFPVEVFEDQIEQAQEDSNVEALILTLNTPGGEVVPSDDLRNLVSDFDGPTIAYATDICASGGYWIASGCDHIFAREGSIVGSIGINGSRINVEKLMENIGVNYEQLNAGNYKDAGNPLKELEDDEREYLQQIVNEYYEEFIDRVTENRPLTETEVKDTEAKLFVGREAEEKELVDEIGTKEDIRTYLADELQQGITIKELEPEVGLRQQLRSVAYSLAYATGAGIASVLTSDNIDIQLRGKY
ncbi:MAG: signal peptide peptidase SppA [Halobacteriaceae archaeon]